MLKHLLIIHWFILLFYLPSIAQTYEISFSRSGASSQLDSVSVTNLNQNTTLKISGADILVLNAIVGYQEIPAKKNSLTSFPNPCKDFCNLSFEVNKLSKVVVEINDICGKKIFHSDYIMEQGNQWLRIENIPKGVYMINVFLNKNCYSEKIISLNNNTHPVKVTLSYKSDNIEAGISANTQQKSKLKNSSSYVNMDYFVGDRLLITGKSGIYNTVMTFIPGSSQNIDIPVVSCTDGSGINYPVLKIGNQTWMALNLRTTQYRDGTFIPEITDKTEWTEADTGAFCNYNNVEDNVKTNGRLYNWLAVTDSRKLAPAGWRVPRLEDFLELQNFLGVSTGGKMKERGFVHWSSPNEKATNETGFSALPVGIRYFNGNFSGSGYYTVFWNTTKTPYNPPSAYAGFLSYVSQDFLNQDYECNSGLSIRCIQGELADIFSDSVLNVTSNSAQVFGSIKFEGLTPVTERGFCWGLSRGPTIKNAFAACGSGAGNFSYTIKGLMQDNQYYVRSYATNSYGTVYGSEIALLTPFGGPYINLKPITDITTSSASAEFEIDSTGGFVSDMHGVCWNLTFYPTIADSLTKDGSGTGVFTTKLTNLLPGRIYHVRAYSTNATGTVYGGYETFTTPAKLPVLSTTEVTGYTFPTAISGGNITDDGGAPILERGVCWSTTYPPKITVALTSDGSGVGSFTSTVSGINNTTQYFIRAYATNSAGTSYGNVIAIVTSLQLGQPYQGGIVVYLSDLNHGIIASQSDIGTVSRWGCWENQYITTSTSIFTGLTNTNTIVAQCTQSGIAARICYDLVLNGYDDWCLPSRDELDILYELRSIIGGFSASYYWSSTESPNTPVDAWAQNFDGGAQGTYNKFFTHRVRAIRYF